MFEKILQFIREAWKKMIGQSDIKSVLKVDVAISQEMSDALTTWANMYTNQADWLSADIISMNLPASIAGEIARAVTIEMKVTVSGSARAKFLQEQIDRLIPLLRKQIESGCALGGMVFKPYLSNGRFAVDFVQADAMMPVVFDGSGNITSAIFADTRTVGDKYYTRLEFHRLEGTTYTVQNLAFVSSVRDQLGRQTNLAEVAEWADLNPITTIANVQKPLFGYFRFPLANNIDRASPLGVSCYARAVNTIEQADKLYSNLVWEFESGKRAVYADIEAFDKTSDGKPILPDRRLYRALKATGDIGDQNKLFEEWTPQFREASILSGLDSLLKRIEFQCGLAYGTISDPNSIEKTATEIASAKQRSAATIVDTQKALKSALDDLLYAIDVLTTLTPSLAGVASRGTFTTVYDFDDSLIVDRAAQRLEDRQDVTLGVMPKYVYLMQTRGLSEVDAKRWIAEAQNEQPEPAFPE